MIMFLLLVGWKENSSYCGRNEDEENLNNFCRSEGHNWIVLTFGLWMFFYDRSYSEKMFQVLEILIKTH
jgi:hypothetical protein